LATETGFPNNLKLLFKKVAISKVGFLVVGRNGLISNPLFEKTRSEEADVEGMQNNRCGTFLKTVAPTFRIVPSFHVP